MKVCINSIYLSLSLLCLLPPIVDAKGKEQIYLRERSDNALRLCLDINYSRLGAYKIKDLKDYSSWTYSFMVEDKYSFEGEGKMLDFIEKNAGGFYKEDLPVKSETPPPHNAIFARCMEFYRSDKLKKFLKTTKP